MAYLTKDYVQRLNFFPKMKYLNLVETKPKTSHLNKSAVDFMVLAIHPPLTVFSVSHIFVMTLLMLIPVFIIVKGKS